MSAGTAMLDPSQRFPTEGLGARIVGVQVLPKENQTGPRLVVVGNAAMASDEFARRGPEGVVFALNAVDWLAQDEALIAIRAKDRRPPALDDGSEAMKQGVQYVNVAGLPLALAVYGFWRLLERRRLAATPYRRAVEAV